MTTPLLDRIGGRRGHFRMESGLHAALWFELDRLFVDPKALDPIVAELTAKLRPYKVDGVCGPLVGGALVAQLLARALDVECYFTERVRGGDASRLFTARYQLPPGLRRHVSGKRLAIVDDVMSAGSSLRATMEEVSGHGAETAVVGALFVLGSQGADFFAQQGLAVEHVGESPFDMWPADGCPLCAAGSTLEDVS